MAAMLGCLVTTKFHAGVKARGYFKWVMVKEIFKKVLNYLLYKPVWIRHPAGYPSRTDTRAGVQVPAMLNKLSPSASFFGAKYQFLYTTESIMPG